MFLSNKGVLGVLIHNFSNFMSILSKWVITTHLEVVSTYLILPCKTVVITCYNLLFKQNQSPNSMCFWRIVSLVDINLQTPQLSSLRAAERPAKP